MASTLGFEPGQQFGGRRVLSPMRQLCSPEFSELVSDILQQGAQKNFHVDIEQSEVEDSFQLASDWIKSARENVNQSKAVTLWSPCCNPMRISWL